MPQHYPPHFFYVASFCVTDKKSRKNSLSGNLLRFIGERITGSFFHHKRIKRAQKNAQYFQDITNLKAST